MRFEQGMVGKLSVKMLTLGFNITLFILNLSLTNIYFMRFEHGILERLSVKMLTQGVQYYIIHIQCIFVINILNGSRST